MVEWSIVQSWVAGVREMELGDLESIIESYAQIWGNFWLP